MPKIYKRYCDSCGKHYEGAGWEKGGRLEPHHVRNFVECPKLRFDVDNGITLCEDYHNEFHKRYGQVNNTKEQLKEFLSLKYER